MNQFSFRASFALEFELAYAFYASFLVPADSYVCLSTSSQLAAINDFLEEPLGDFSWTKEVLFDLLMSRLLS